MRRKPGTLLAREIVVCTAAANLLVAGIQEFHGYELAKRLTGLADHRLLSAYGTLYRTLGRLERMGFLISRWEDQNVAVRESRPGRRFYMLTASGLAALKEAQAAPRAQIVRRSRCLVSA
jgi:DNA-binding PadR family transcriptional regulator